MKLKYVEYYLQYFGRVLIGSSERVYILPEAGGEWSDYFTYPGSIIKSIAVNPSVSSFIIGALEFTDNGLIYSSDSRETWQLTRTP